MNMYKIVRPLLWKTDPEKAHDFVLNGLQRLGRSGLIRNVMGRMYTKTVPELQVEAFGVTFPNCIGLAAGLDKNGRALPALATLGFGFVEVGTITPRPQEGNPRPRMWRLPEHEALINRLGFNNAGAEVAGDNLARDGRRVHVPLGVNIGKNADTPLEQAIDDYIHCWRTLHLWADYVVVNISSPNTPGLRALQATQALDELLAALRPFVERTSATPDTGPTRRPNRVPLLVKIAPDMLADDLDGIVESCLKHGVSGLIATNTTIGRQGITDPPAEEAGGLSGRPLTDLSNHIVAALYRRVDGRLPIIGVGGIMNARDAYMKIKAGATLTQVLTGFIYEGPAFPGQLALGLQKLLRRDGLTHISEAVGVEAYQYGEPTGH